MTAQANTNLILRNDTILGVCEAIGQDFGFNPTWLRIAFCLPVFWNPAAARLFGWNAEEVLGRPLSALVAPRHRPELESALEELRQCLGRDTNAVVCHTEMRLSVGLCNLDQDLASCRRVLDRITDEVVEHLLKSHPIPVTHYRVLWHLHANGVAIGLNSSP